MSQSLSPTREAAEENSSSSRRSLTLLAAFLGWMFDGMEMGIFPLVAGPALREMGRAHGLEMDSPELKQYTDSSMALVTAFFLFGAAAGGLLFGWIGDKIGRVRAMSWSILCYSLFTGLCYFATEPWHWTGLRFTAALGMGGEWALGVALVMESWPEKWRPFLAGLIGAAANFGYVIIAIVGINFQITEDSWRWVMIIGAAPALLTFLIRIFVPESHRWEVAHRNSEESPVRVIFSPKWIKNTLLAIVFASIALIVTWGIVQWIPLWVDQVVGQKDPIRKAIIQLCSASGAVVGSLIAPLIGNILGRRWTYFLLCLASILACEWLFLGFSSYGPPFLAVVCLVGCTTASFYGWLPLYLPELFPTHARATGQGLAFNFGRILAGMGVLFMPMLMQVLSGVEQESSHRYANAGSRIVLVYLLGMILIWFAPETKGKKLPD